MIATKTFNPMDDGEDHGLGRARIHRQIEIEPARASESSGSRSTSPTTSIPDTPQEETLQALRRLRRAGKVGAVGASNFNAEQLAEALEISMLEGLPRYEWVQNGFSLLEQGDTRDRLPPRAASTGSATRRSAPSRVAG